MKKIFTLFAVLVMAVASTAFADDTEPAWVGQLRQCSPITSVTYKYAEFDMVTQVSFTYEQPLCHTNPDGEKLSLRGVIYIPDEVDPDTCVTELYFSGYDLMFSDDSYLFNVSFYDQVTQIAKRYNGCYIELEHRYYKKSAPSDPWTRLEYLNANEAAQDFHAIIQALKKVFTGKWAINGVSKGGMTATFQYAYYPDDADLYMANCSPYFTSMTDKRMHKYIAENGLTPELREKLMADRRAILKDADAVKEFQQIYQKDHPEATAEQCQRRFYTMIMEQYGYAFRSVNRKNIEKTLHDNDSVMDLYMKQFNVTSSFLNAVRALDYKTDATDTWTSYLTQNFPNAVRRKVNKVGEYTEPHYEITEEQWRSDDEVPFYYQTCREFGDYTYDFHYLFTDEADKALADSLQAFYDLNGGDYVTVLFPFFKDVKYDDGAFINFTLGKIKEATKPILFLYGEDDCFTGCQIEDQYLNGTTTRKYILSTQNHGVRIDKDEDQKDEIWAYLDKYLRNGATGIKGVSAQQNTTATGNTFNLSGQKVNANTHGIIISDGKKVLK